MAEEAMEWTESLKMAVDYMEKHLLEDISAESVADSVHVSSFYFQRGFKIVTGYTIGEYIRNRRLYLAALEVIGGRRKVIDLAYRYGYDTPESFTKAFSRFHGVSPMQMKNDSSKIKTFLPLKISIIVKGGDEMDFFVEKMKGFGVIGFEGEFSLDNSYQEIPKFWDAYCEKYKGLLFAGGKPQNEIEQIICECRIGMFGVCIDDSKTPGFFRYLIAGEYHGETVPEGMCTFFFPDVTWAKFRCIGQLPGAMQSVNTKIFNEWLPGNPDYEIAMSANIEWYSKGNMSAADYESGIWVPVKSRRKTQEESEVQKV